MPPPQRDLPARQPFAGRTVRAAREDRRHEVVGALREQRHVGVVRAQQPQRVVHDPLEHLGRLPQDREAAGDLAQRALRVGPTRQLLA